MLKLSQQTNLLYSNHTEEVELVPGFYQNKTWDFSLISHSLLTFNFSISYGDMNLFDLLYEVHGLPQLMSLNGIWAFKFSIPRCSILLHGSTFTMTSKVELMRGESIQQVTLVQVWSRLQVSGDWCREGRLSTRVHSVIIISKNL